MPFVAVLDANVIVTEDSDFRDQCVLARDDLGRALDAQGCAEFTAFAVDVAPQRAAEALHLMASNRWVGQHEGDVWERLLAWMKRMNWTMTADLLPRHFPD